MAMIVDDRLLARVARDSVAWNDAADPASLLDIALGQAVLALRVLGVAPTPEVTRAVGDDIADIIADPEQLARARDFARRAAEGLPPARLAA